MNLINRHLKSKILSDLETFPSVAILGPRQCGKSTLAKLIGQKISNFLYIDLEKRSDFQMVSNSELFFHANRNKIICIDEIQLMPELFSYLRSEIDEFRHNGRFILLGSASRELLQKSSQSLAGRIGYRELTPFIITELVNEQSFDFKQHWFRGGYPNSYFANDDEKSMTWLDNFINTYIERDIPMLGIGISSFQLKRFINILSGLHGQLVNLSRIGESIGLSHTTIRSYINLFEQCYIIRVLQPYEKNIKKRIVKTPKLYFRDSGILHSLIKTSSFNELMGNIALGASWEGYAIENLITMLPDCEHSFYRTSSGEEIDLIIERGKHRIAIEFKISSAPKLSKGFWICIDDLKITESFIVTPNDNNYKIKENVTVTNISDCILNIKNLIS